MVENPGPFLKSFTVLFASQQQLSLKLSAVNCNFESLEGSAGNNPPAIVKNAAISIMCSASASARIGYSDPK
jgi:hypothetical protein